MIALVGALAVFLGGCSKTEEPKEEPKAPEAAAVVAPAPEATPVAPAAETAVAPADPAAAPAVEPEKKDAAAPAQAK
jgi:PBP1b-binding outer membrane lipoprotein LpoB